MSRWGKPRKNVKRIDPRYFMDEKMEIPEEQPPQPDAPPHAPHQPSQEEQSNENI